MLENIDAVIFDLDGTLIDSMGVWTDIDEEFLRKYDLKKPVSFYENMEGKSFSETAQYFLDTFPKLKHTRSEIEDEWNRMAYDRYMNVLRLKKGARTFIMKMHHDGRKLGIATSNIRVLTEGVLRNNEVFSYFDAICTADEIKSGKSSPEVFLESAKKLRTAPERCLVFEDIPTGIMAAKNAGMKVCAVYDSFSNNKEKEKRELADYYIEDYTCI